MRIYGNLRLICVSSVNLNELVVIYVLPLCLSTLLSGSGPRVSEAAQPEEQAGEQTGEHRSEEDTHGTPVRGSGTGTGGWILERKRSRRCAGMGGSWVPPKGNGKRNGCVVG